MAEVRVSHAVAHNGQHPDTAGLTSLLLNNVEGKNLQHCLGAHCLDSTANDSVGFLLAVEAAIAAQFTDCGDNLDQIWA